MTNMKKKISSLQVAATYIGVVVGAGFGSGQEILQFFGYFGLWGILGLLLAGLLFIYFGSRILNLGHELKAESHLPIIQYAGGSLIGTIIDYVITFFLFGALTAMAAGAGAVFAEQFGLSPMLGNALMVIVTLLTVLAGISGVITAISLIVPILLVVVFAISLYTIIAEPGAGFTTVPPGHPAVPFWPLAAIVYVSYNLVMAVAILGPLGNTVEQKKVLGAGAFYGGLGLALCAVAILLAILFTLPQSAQYAIPMIYVAGQISPVVQILYSLILFAEVYTTAVGSLYGFVVRLTKPETARSRHLAIGASLGAFVASQVGFTYLVRILYPAVGYAGLLLLGGLLLRSFGPMLVPTPSPALRPGLKKEKEKKDDKE